ncbi:MAG TPA: enoyl-CoA hydratase-related protein [Thermoplasmata archaeon]|nr:enoyl-CoA hydratase-related protein [Thermoplasmata archaeon]
MSGSEELVRWACLGPVATLTIDHPPVNVLSARVLEALLARLAEVAAQGEVRSVVLAGAAEKAFAAGADIREMAGMGPAEARIHGGRGQAVTTAIERLPIPVIAAVHGACLGGGCEIAMACDLVLASEDARFGQPEINLGVMPGWGGTQRLPRRIGTARAREWILTGRTATAAEAAELGLVLRVLPRAELLPAAHALAAELATKSATAIAAAKQVLRGAVDRSLDAGLSEELELWQGLFATPDQKEGMASFVAKRAWTPRPRTPNSLP